MQFSSSSFVESWDSNGAKCFEEYLQTNREAAKNKDVPTSGTYSHFMAETGCNKTGQGHQRGKMENDCKICLVQGAETHCLLVPLEGRNCTRTKV